MIFDKIIDKNLYLILSSDIKNREDIAKIIYNIPKELLDRINLLLTDNELPKQYKIAKYDKDNNMYMYTINIYHNEITIIYNKWYNNQTKLEEEYKLTLGRINEIDDYPKYIGNYTSKKSQIIYNKVFATGTERDYELTNDTPLGNIISLSDDPNRYWIVNLKNKLLDIEQKDLKDRASINKLIKRRNKK